MSQTRFFYLYQGGIKFWNGRENPSTQRKPPNFSRWTNKLVLRSAMNGNWTQAMNGEWVVFDKTKFSSITVILRVRHLIIFQSDSDPHCLHFNFQTRLSFPNANTYAACKILKFIEDLILQLTLLLKFHMVLTSNKTSQQHTYMSLTELCRTYFMGG